MREGWDYQRIGDVCTVVGGATPKTDIKEYWDGENYWITPADLDGSKFQGSTPRTITDLAIQKTNLQLLPIGTVLLSSRAPIGKVAITTVPMYCNQGFKNIVCSDRLLNEFVYWYLYYSKDFLNSLGTGATFKEISKKTTENIIIPIPSIQEQERIVAELDLLTGIIDKQKQQLKELDNLAQSVFYDMFGNKANSSRLVSLSDVCSVVKGLVNPNDEPYCNYPHIGGANIESNTGRFVDVKTAKEENLISGKYPFDDTMILYSKIRPNLNKVALPSFVGICSADMYPLIPNSNINRIYLKYVLTQKEFLSYAISHSGRANIPKINREDLLSYTFNLFDINLQNAFALRIQAIESQKESINRSIAESQKLIDYTMDKYFN